MSDQPGRESMSDDLTTYSVDDEDQLQPEDTLIPGEDPVEAGYDAPDRLRGSLAFGVTADEQAQEETIEQRIRQEVPDPDTAYGAPDNESGLDEPEMAGGDDPDAIPAERDFVGDGAYDVGRLVAPDGGAESDSESEAYAEELPRGRRQSPEQAAMHYTESDDQDVED
ncbi:DUF5709 domain-containing protein [Ornithinimicrobium sediminis]|uniref:DUF5709 domain-containing protein n=1 Tax=Ornithinimicrobium sediminis TaxID=2904603 RepID=UPI001E529B49|nr:DUF5709 domain-containing protein [Ornithinimicrobium sediminis]MCE0485313.1 DUF5709 domain-containing protein [Ornithinimicrobium sediminis]